MKLSSCEGRKHNCAILLTACKLYPLYHTTCACASCGEPSAPQEQEELVAWARKCPIWSQLQFHFCPSATAHTFQLGFPDTSCRAQWLLLWSMHFSHSPSPCTTVNCQHMCLCVLHGPACFSGTKGPNLCLITRRLCGVFVMRFPVVIELPISQQTFHNPRCPLALMDGGWQPLVTRRQGWEAHVHLERRRHICCCGSEGVKGHDSTLW